MRLFFIIPCCAVQAVLGYDGPPPLTEVDGRSPIRMGGEMLGGYRSYYIHRGEKTGGDSLEGGSFRLAPGGALPRGGSGCGGFPWRARFPAEPPCRIPGR